MPLMQKAAKNWGRPDSINKSTWEIIRRSLVKKWSILSIDYNAKYKVDLLWDIDPYAGPIGFLIDQDNDGAKDSWRLQVAPSEYYFFGAVKSQWNNRVVGVSISVSLTYKKRLVQDPITITYTAKTGYYTRVDIFTGTITESPKTARSFNYVKVTYWWDPWSGYMDYEGVTYTIATSTDYYELYIYDEFDYFDEICGAGYVTYTSSRSTIIPPDGYETDNFNPTKSATLIWIFR